MRSVIVGLCCLAAFSAMPVARAGEQSVDFTTEPAGAWVCKKVLSKETCTTRTPSRVSVTIAQQGAAAKYVLKRFGYRPLTVRVEEGARTFSHKLERLDFLTDPAAHKDKKLAALQRAVNPKLRQLVLSAESDYAFNLAGKATVVKFDGMYVLEENLADPAFEDKMVRFVRASMKGWKYAEENPDEAAEIVLDNDATGAQTEAHQKRMMGEIAKLTAGSNGALDPADYERTVASLLAGGSDPVITKAPEGAWTHDITDAALN